MVKRCGWCAGNELYVRYHDEEWGVPLFDDRKLFEMLVLEGAQAGLSWLTILRKRESYREAFEGFEPATIAAWTEAEVERLMGNAGIVRNRRKIHSVIRNAQGVLEIQQSEGSFSAFLWSFTANHPINNSWTSAAEIPTRSRESDLMSSALNRHGFSFTGSTICYAFMQAVGMVNDHLVSCFRHEEIMRLPSSNRERGFRREP